MRNQDKEELPTRRELTEFMRHSMSRTASCISLVLRSTISYEQKMDIVAAALHEFRDQYSALLLACIMVAHLDKDLPIAQVVGSFTKAALEAHEDSERRLLNLVEMLRE